MKILIVCSSWRVFGAETITLKMLEGFKLRGHEQIAVTSIWTDGEMSRRLNQLGIREEKMAFGSVVASLSPKYIKWTLDCLLRLPILWWQWQRLMHTFKPDVIIWTSSKQALLLLPFLDKKASFLIEHTLVAPSKNMRWLYRRLSKKLTGFIAVSDFMRHHFEKLGVAQDQINVIKNGPFVAAERPAGERKSGAFFQITGEPTRIGIAGQISPHKGHEQLLGAARLLQQRGVRFNIKVFGSGDENYLNSLRLKITESGLEPSWHWMGYISDRQKIYSSMDICVMPSCFEEPFGLVAAEASSYSLPVIANRRGALPEIIDDGVTGLLMEPNSPEQLAEKIQFLINNPQTAANMGRAGQERVFKYFTVERMVAEFEQLFNGKLNGAKKAEPLRNRRRNL